jgi:hypothetical protein
MMYPDILQLKICLSIYTQRESFDMNDTLLLWLYSALICSDGVGAKIETDDNEIMNWAWVWTFCVDFRVYVLTNFHQFVSVVNDGDLLFADIYAWDDIRSLGANTCIDMLLHCIMTILTEMFELVKLIFANYIHTQMFKNMSKLYWRTLRYTGL